MQLPRGKDEEEDGPLEERVIHNVVNHFPRLVPRVHEPSVVQTRAPEEAGKKHSFKLHEPSPKLWQRQPASKSENNLLPKRIASIRDRHFMPNGYILLESLLDHKIGWLQ